ncbi:hypothetical protein RRG08_063968 [Elysia crispata]|uniref:Uncharacterized protein n=1 Tax=Elysia crispata TaxID=231223 RepID=A0AAE0YEI1_9GAST|nr:hypothetical protein RRG08_063968 [Elysia crispata]
MEKNCHEKAVLAANPAQLKKSPVILIFCEASDPFGLKTQSQRHSYVQKLQEPEQEFTKAEAKCLKLNADQPAAFAIILLNRTRLKVLELSDTEIEAVILTSSKNDMKVLILRIGLTSSETALPF